MRRKSVSNQEENVHTSSSPINILNKVINKIKSPRLISTPTNTTSTNMRKTLNKTTKHDNHRKSHVDAPSPIISNSEQDDSVIDIDSDDEITCIKKLYTSECEISQNQVIKPVEEVRQPSSINTELENQKKENKALQETSRDLLRQKQKLKQEHEKLLQTVETKNNEVINCKKRIQSDAKALQEKEKCIKELENKLASASADSLIFQEQNKKLREDIKALKAEKVKLIDKLVASTGVTDSIESKLESEIDSLKSDLMLEIQQIKEQIKRSTDLQATLENQTSTLNGESQTRRGNTGQTNKGSERPSHVRLFLLHNHLLKVFSLLEMIQPAFLAQDLCLIEICQLRLKLIKKQTLKQLKAHW